MSSLSNTDLCTVCYEQDPESRLIRLNCGRSCCAECLVSWILTKLNEPHYQIGQSLSCIASDCQQPFRIQDIGSELSGNLLNSINDALLQVYLNKTQDVRRCPIQTCQYAGVIDVSASCGDNLECSVCSYQWREKAHFTKRDLIRNFFIQKSHRKNEILSHIWKKFYTKQCPGCNTNIQKNQGCQHMTCTFCKHEFCWTCKWPTPDHDHAVHRYQEITKPVLISLGLLVLLVVSTYLLYQIPLVRTIANWTIIPVVRFLRRVASRLFNFIKAGSIWLFSILWKVAVVTLFDFSLRTFLFAQDLSRRQRVACVAGMAGACAVTHYFGVYRAVTIIGIVETVSLSLVSLVRHTGLPSFRKKK